MPLLFGTLSHLTVDPVNSSVLLLVRYRQNCLTLLTVNTRPSHCHLKPLIRLWHMALYKCDYLKQVSLTYVPVYICTHEITSLNKNSSNIIRTFTKITKQPIKRLVKLSTVRNWRPIPRDRQNSFAEGGTSKVWRSRDAELGWISKIRPVKI